MNEDIISPLGREESQTLRTATSMRGCSWDSCRVVGYETRTGRNTWKFHALSRSICWDVAKSLAFDRIVQHNDPFANSKLVHELTYRSLANRMNRSLGQNFSALFSLWILPVQSLRASDQFVKSVQARLEAMDP